MINCVNKATGIKYQAFEHELNIPADPGSNYLLKFSGFIIFGVGEFTEGHFKKEFDVISTRS